MTRVAITGIGVVSPVGSGRAAFWQGLVSGRSGIGPIDLFDVSAFPVRFGGQVRDVEAAKVGSRFADAQRERDRKVLLGLVAMEEAITDARLSADRLKPSALHVGVSLEAFFLQDMTRVAESGTLASSLIDAVTGCAGAPCLQTPLDRLTDIAGEHWRIHGPRLTNCSACAAGAQAIGHAYRDVREGLVPVAIAGAADSMLNPLGLGGFSLLKILSTENDQPAGACRPFDATRQGTVLGEGAAFLVLEPLEAAQSRGARIYAEVLGYGSSMDAFRLSDPEPTGRGAVLSMSSALRDAALEPHFVDGVSAHGTGTPKNDAVETAAIKEALGARARQIPVHSIKSMTGHMIAASGAAEAVAAALTLAESIIPPTINLSRPDPDCDLDYVPNKARAFEGRTVLSNSFGFGGQNATLIFARYPR